MPCVHSSLERSWVDTYTSIYIDGAINVGYHVLEYYELWHYPKGSDKFCKDFILNIVQWKILQPRVSLLKRNKTM